MSRRQVVVVAGGMAVGAAFAAFQFPEGVSGSEVVVADEIRPLAAAGFTGMGGQPGALPGVVIVPRAPQDEVGKLLKSGRIEERRAAEEAEAAREAERVAELARRPKAVAPVQGVITSNYGPRWGTTHYGLDIANSVGTPIRSVMDGVVVEAGPASGFGLWIKIEHPDGTITVFGHINSYSVSKGQQVKAGEIIAEVGNRGVSTGPHLHFEVWDPDGRKVDPLAWLQDRGADIA